MDKRINLRLDKNMYDFIEGYRVENHLDDNSDALRKIVWEKMDLKNLSFFEKLKNLF